MKDEDYEFAIKVSLNSIMFFYNVMQEFNVCFVTLRAFSDFKLKNLLINSKYTLL